MAVIVNLILLNVTTPVNCQVRDMARVCSGTLRSDLSQPKGLRGSPNGWSSDKLKLQEGQLLARSFPSDRSPATWPLLLPLSCLCSACTSSDFYQYDRLPGVGVHGGHQRCHLGKRSGCGGDRNRHMGDQQCVPHPRWVPFPSPGDLEI